MCAGFSSVWLSLQKLIDDMMRAAENDHAAYRAGRPALFKEEMLEVRL
jgi:hypothetical protein